MLNLKSMHLLSSLQATLLPQKGIQIFEIDMSSLFANQKNLVTTQSGLFFLQKSNYNKNSFREVKTKRSINRKFFSYSHSPTSLNIQNLVVLVNRLDIFFKLLILIFIESSHRKTKRVIIIYILSKLFSHSLVYS